MCLWIFKKFKYNSSLFSSSCKTAIYDVIVVATFFLVLIFFFRSLNLLLKYKYKSGPIRSSKFPCIGYACVSYVCMHKECFSSWLLWASNTISPLMIMSAHKNKPSNISSIIDHVKIHNCLDIQYCFQFVRLVTGEVLQEFLLLILTFSDISWWVSETGLLHIS